MLTTKLLHLVPFVSLIIISSGKKYIYNVEKMDVDRGK